jgi:uncharacterized membrane protein YtjA (UPF0391 family)
MEVVAAPLYNRGESWPGSKIHKSLLGPVPAFVRTFILHFSQEVSMLRWALGFFIVALVAALLGFTGISVAAAGIAKILFYLFLILFLVTLVGHLLRRT